MKIFFKRVFCVLFMVLLLSSVGFLSACESEPEIEDNSSKNNDSSSSVYAIATIAGDSIELIKECLSYVNDSLIFEDASCNSTICKDFVSLFSSSLSLKQISEFNFENLSLFAQTTESEKYFFFSSKPDENQDEEIWEASVVKCDETELEFLSFEWKYKNDELVSLSLKILKTSDLAGSQTIEFGKIEIDLNEKTIFAYYGSPIFKESVESQSCSQFLLSVTQSNFRDVDWNYTWQATFDFSDLTNIGYELLFEDDKNNVTLNFRDDCYFDFDFDDCYNEKYLIFISLYECENYTQTGKLQEIFETIAVEFDEDNLKLIIQGE